MSQAGSKKRITIERTLRAPVEDVWELWTTKEGIESWWGPDGFTTKVFKLELRPEGELHYAMTATAPEQVDFLKRAGMPLTSETRGWYDEIVPAPPPRVHAGRRLRPRRRGLRHRDARRAPPERAGRAPRAYHRRHA